MHMHIRHETRYRYERPVKYSVQSLHLTPRRDLAIFRTCSPSKSRTVKFKSSCAASSKLSTPKDGRTTDRSRPWPISRRPL